MWTKRELIAEAFSELTLAESEFDLTPEEQETALRRLDTMMAMWDAKGIRIGYALPTGANGSDLDQPSGIPDSATETVYLNLALRIAPGFGKQLSQDTRKNARDGYDVLLWAAAQPQAQQMPNTMPRGAGNKPWSVAGRPFFPTPSNDPLQISQGGDLDFLE